MNIQKYKYSWTVSALLFFVSATHAPTIAFAQTNAATVDANALLGFKRIFIEPPTDNIDGAFAAPIQQSYANFFRYNPRFQQVATPQQADTIIKTVVEQTSAATKLELIISLQNNGVTFTKESLQLKSGASGQEMHTAIKTLLIRGLKRIPFYGTVTGRENNEIVLDIGEKQGVKVGDLVQLARVSQIKTHPLLKSVVDVELTPSGTALINATEDQLAFAQILDEYPGENVRTTYKITSVEEVQNNPAKSGAIGRTNKLSASTLRNSREKIAAKLATQKTQDETDPVNRPQDTNKDAADSDDPQYTKLVIYDDELGNTRYGQAELAGFLGSFSSNVTSTSPATIYSDGALTLGVRALGEAWLTKEWIIEGQFGLASTSVTQALESTSSSSNTTTTSNSSTLRHINLMGGYRYLIEDNIEGPQIKVKLGYTNFHWSTSSIESARQSAKTYSGLSIGLGGLVPLHYHDLGISGDITVLLLPSSSEGSYKTGTNKESTTSFTFYLGAYYKLSNELRLKAGLLFESYSMDFDNDTVSTNQKFIGFVPSIVYFF